MMFRQMFSPGCRSGGKTRSCGGEGIHFGGFRAECDSSPLPGRDGTAGAALLMLLLLLGLAVSMAPPAQAGELYRYTAPDGSVLYTNMPMAPAQAERIFHDPPAPASGLGSSAQQAPSPMNAGAATNGFLPAGRAGKSAAASHLIPHFPLVKQKGPWCVAASAEMVLKYYGFPGRQDDIAFAAYENRGTGTSLATISRYINRIAGLRAWLRERTSFDIVKRCIDANVPVLVPLKEPGQSEGHLAVAIGYDDGRQIMTLAEPATGSTIQVPYRSFLKVWTGATVTVTPTRL
ncbi:MAG: DUF4124 domain-containing protein [Syntrophaceae bacterium]|nr:DUF4124 domain-containing protein [Syntrophaceae bacterium]